MQTIARAKVIMLIFFALFYSEFPVIFLDYAPNSMHYFQDHFQNNPVTFEMILYWNARLLY